ncbi:thiamine pyrophosphate-dependent enzyme [uncultured Slackia sp.]|uniref:thiamine pyrophosphate-dependent enzyme n=1 Tax=uncultured Slackia sp. TaxID=665903 RepID=UPI002626F5DD|nr:thiamine pyrophosphate-dependent enzyme [uncultured Slackia sp.]
MAKKLLMGNEAFACAALESGVGVVAGYPGTPSSEVIETVAARVADGSAQGTHVEWSTNEKAALEVVAGASYAGARTLFTCKQVGLNVASDPLMSLNYVGVKGGCVLFVADDPGPISSQTEQDTRRFASFAKVPVLDPADVEQGFAMMKAAFDLSERYGTPVIVRPTTRVCHSSTFLEIQGRTDAYPADGFVKDDNKWVIFPARAYRGHLEIQERLARIEGEFSGNSSSCSSEHEDLSLFNPVTERGDAPRFGIVCGGVSTAYALEALEFLSQRAALPSYRFMQIGTPFPFPAMAASAFLEGLERVIVFEELDHVIEDELVRLVGLRAMRGLSPTRVCGRRSGDARTAGENSVEDIFERLERFFACAELEEEGLSGLDLEVAIEEQVVPLSEAQPADVELPVRPPVLCAGCPHRGAFYAAKQALRKMRARGVLSGDVGCYTLGNAAPLDAVDTCLCMGAGITMAQGLGIVEPDVRQVAFVGDSTFFASGLTGIANAVYNQHDITVCVLDNSTTAMTGGQPHPGIGRTLMGGQSEPLSIEAALEALGVACIEHANPHRFEESVSAVIRAVKHVGPSVVIFRAPCVNLIKPEASVSIDAEGCTGCRKCITSIGCPAIGFDGAKAYIDETLCVGCGLCVQVCPFDVIKQN